MQYIGLGDVFGRFIDQIPTLAIRLGQFLLTFIRRFLANPLGFATTILGALLAVDLVDKIVYEVSNALSTVVKSIQSSIQSSLSKLTTTNCGTLDFVCYIRNGLIWFAQTILSIIFTYIVNPLLGALSYILGLVAYVAKTIMYNMAKLICSYVDYVYPVIAGGYVAYRAFTWIGIRLISKISFGRIMSAILGPFASFIIAMALSKALLDFMLSLLGISCSSLTKPTMPTVTTPIPTPVSPPQIGTNVTYGLSYSGAVGRLVTNVATSARYIVSIGQSQGLKQVRTISGTYALTAVVRPPIIVPITVALTYGLTPTTAPTLTLAFTDSESGMIYTTIRVAFTIGESASYSLTSLMYLAIIASIAVGLTYALTLQKSWGCTVSGTNITCSDSTATVGVIFLVTASDSASTAAALYLVAASDTVSASGSG